VGEKTPQPSQHDGRLSLLPIPTGRKVGPSRFPGGWQQVGNRSQAGFENGCIAPNFSKYDEVSAALEKSARFAAVLLLRHLAAAEFSENRDRLFGSVEPINTYAVVGVSVLRDLEYIVRSVVVKFHGQRDALKGSVRFRPTRNTVPRIIRQFSPQSPTITEIPVGY
jgi:hypothetical protein